MLCQAHLSLTFFFFPFFPSNITGTGMNAHENKISHD